MKRKFLQDFWHLFHAYWRSEEKWGARGILAVVVVLTLGQVYLLVQLNNWNNDFYNALQNYAFELFWPLIGQFSLLAFIYIFVAVYAIYLRQKLQIRWRTWMTHRYLESWMARQVYYRLQVMGSDMDNPDQPVCEFDAPACSGLSETAHDAGCLCGYFVGAVRTAHASAGEP